MTEPEVILKPFDSRRPHFSFSQINSYIRCSMQYYFRYVLGLPDNTNLPMLNGTAGHAAVEANAKNKIETKDDLSNEQLLDIYSDNFNKELEEFDQSNLEPGESAEHTKDLTTQSLTIWRYKYAPSITPKAVELEFTVPLPPTEDFHDELKPITGRIDRIAKRGHIMQPKAKPIQRTEVIDVKFPTRLPSNLQMVADLSDQLTMYDMVLNKAGVGTQELGFEHFVPPTKTLPARILQTYRSREMMTPEARAARFERLMYKLRTIARAITQGIFIPTDDPRVCSNCAYRKRCQFSLAKSDYDAIQIRAKAARK